MASISQSHAAPVATGQSKSTIATASQPEAVNATSGQSEATQATVGQSETIHAIAGQSKSAHAAACQSEAAHDVASRLEADYTTAGQLEAGHNAASQSEADYTAAGQLEADHALTGQSEAAPAAACQSDIAVDAAAAKEARSHTPDSNVPDGDCSVEAQVREFLPACRALPKVELHAHLNGCVRDATLLECARYRALVAESTEGGEKHGVCTRGKRSEEAAGVGAGTGAGAHSGPAATTMADVRAMLSKPDGTSHRPLEHCFDLFGAIHQLCTDLGTLERIAAEAVLDFAADGVIYLELRTTPKNLPARGVSKEAYCDAVLRGMAFGAELASRGKGSNYSNLHLPLGSDYPLGAIRPIGSGEVATALTSAPAIVARLILSVDRRETSEEATRTVRLAAKLRDGNRGVVGVDLSGDPTRGCWATFYPPLALARQLGLPITLHCGEVKTPCEEAAMLLFRPERLGHCVKTVRDEELWRQLRKTGTPVELCITSNVITDSIHGGNGGGGGGRNDNDGSCSNGGGGGMGKGAKGINTAAAAARHHLGIMFSAGHPICICTDDPGVFSTTLSREYALAAASMELRDDDLRRLAVQAMDFAFLGVSAVSAAASHRTLGTAADASHWPPDVSSVPYSQPASMASDAERHQNDAANKALAVAVRRQLEIGVAAWSGLPKTMT